MRAAITLWMLLAATCAHAEIYRWTDAQGRVHYSDHAPAQGAQRIDQAPSPAPLSTEEAQQRIDKLRAEVEVRAQARAKAREEATQRAGERETKAAQCAQARAQLAAMTSARRVTAPDGTVHHGNARLEQMAALRAAITKLCAPAS